MESIVINGDIFRLKGSAKKAVLVIIRLICLSLFAISAYDKIVDHERFMNGLSKVNYIGNYSLLISWIVPVSEIMVCLVLLVPETLELGLYAFTGLMAVFTLYIGSMLFWAEKLPCHCNLIMEKLSFGEHLVFNLAFIGLAIFGLWLNKKKS